MCKTFSRLAAHPCEALPSEMRSSPAGLQLVRSQ